jgi:hypothetical protein
VIFFYKNDEIFRFKSRSGNIIVTPISSDEREFNDNDSALEFMADLTAMSYVADKS